MAAAASDTWKMTAFAAAAAEPDFSVLAAALEAAGMQSALDSEGPFTVFAPTNAAFEKFCQERQLSKTQLLELMEEQLPEILKYHVVAGSALYKDDIKAGELESIQGYSLDISTDKKVDNASIVGADMKVSNGVIHAVDEVLVPPFLINSKVKPIPEILKWGEGWGAEVLNGRLAMLGFVYAVAGEITEGRGVLSQLGAHFGDFAFAILLWSIATAAPAMNSSIGYTADPNSMENSKEWKTIMKGGPWPMISGVFTPGLEKNLGYGAMAGFLGLIVIELFTKGPLFNFSLF